METFRWHTRFGLSQLDLGYCENPNDTILNFSIAQGSGASISQNLWGGPTCNNQNFFGEILRISFALLVHRNSTFDVVFFFSIKPFKK